MSENGSNTESSRMEFGLIDLIILLLVCSALVLFFLWLGQRLPLDKLPDPVSKAFGWVTGLLGTGGLLTAAFRSRLTRASPWFYLLGIPVGTSLMFGAVVAVNKWFPNPEVVADHTPPEFWVQFRFQAQPADAKAPAGTQPVILFSQLEPLPRVVGAGQVALASAPGSLYKTRITLPERGKQFIGAIGRNQNQEARRGPYVGVTNMRFARRKADPPDESHAYAKLDCTEGQSCTIDNQDPPQGWVENIAFRRLPLLLNEAVHAQNDQPGALPWIVPTLDTLEKQAGQWQTGFTKFSIQGAPGSHWEPFDFFTYAIQANSVPVAVNGWRPEFLRVPIDRSKGLELQFGLENLDFAGLEAGCDTIQVDLTFHGRDGQTKTVKLFRNYIAMRNAEPVTIAAPNGLSFTWSGEFVQAQDKYEVFVGSTPSVNTAVHMKAQLDSGRLSYQEAEIRGRIRPPLTNTSFGVAIGLKQPNGQIRFGWSQPEARALSQWWSQTLERNHDLRNTFQVSPFVYRVKANGQNSDLRVCTASGVRS